MESASERCQGDATSVVVSVGAIGLQGAAHGSAILLYGVVSHRVAPHYHRLLARVGRKISAWVLGTEPLSRGRGVPRVGESDDGKGGGEVFSFSLFSLAGCRCAEVQMLLALVVVVQEIRRGEEAS